LCLALTYILSSIQTIIEDVSPLVALQMEGSILRGLMNLFVEYTIILERAITCEKIVTEKYGSNWQSHCHKRSLF
jgi:hypothetical protein